MGIFDFLFGKKKKEAFQVGTHTASTMSSGIPTFDVPLVFRSFSLFLYAAKIVEQAWVEVAMPEGGEEPPFLMVSVMMKKGHALEELVRHKDMAEVIGITQYLLREEKSSVTDITLQEPAPGHTAREGTVFFPAPALEEFARARGLMG